MPGRASPLRGPRREHTRVLFATCWPLPPIVTATPDLFLCVGFACLGGLCTFPIFFILENIDADGQGFCQGGFSIDFTKVSSHLRPSAVPGCLPLRLGGWERVGRCFGFSTATACSLPTARARARALGGLCVLGLGAAGAGRWHRRGDERGVPAEGRSLLRLSVNTGTSCFLVLMEVGFSPTPSPGALR